MLRWLGCVALGWRRACSASVDALLGLRALDGSVVGQTLLHRRGDIYRSGVLVRRP